MNIAIINNGYLGMVRQWQEFFYGGRYVATPMSSPDYVKLAEAHGLVGLRVTKRSEVDGAVRKARELPGTVIIDFRVEQLDYVLPNGAGRCRLRRDDSASGGRCRGGRT